MGPEVRQCLPQTVAQRESVKCVYCRRVLKGGSVVRFLLIAKVLTGQPWAWRSGGACTSQWPGERVYEVDRVGGCLSLVLQ